MTDPERLFSENELLLTGANGFLGKVVLAVLLDRFPRFQHLHLLLRGRGGLSACDRFFEETLSTPALASIAQMKGKEFLKTKITVWPGDISLLRCGLSDADMNGLRGRIGLILNCAGRVDFFPPLDDSFSANVDGVRNVIRLAQDMDAKLLHVSTCFVCGEADGLIEESEPISGFYPHRRGPEDRSFDADEELVLARKMMRQIYESDGLAGEKPKRSRELAQRLAALGKQRAATWGWVNTYTYAKSLGEQIIAAAEGLEFAIVRPAIVESAWQFPFPGWIEGGRTAAPLVLMALGGLKDWPVREDAPLEIIPVDMVASGILAVAALLLEGRHKKVYQLASADVNPLEVGEVVTLLDAEARRRKDGDTWSRALIDLMAGTGGRSRVRFVSEEEALNRRLKLEKGIARAQRLVGRAKTALEKAGLPGSRWVEGAAGELRKLDLRAKFREHTLGQYLPFVLQNRYLFECENIRDAYASLSDAGRQALPWRPEVIDWKEYWVKNQIEGIEKWVQPEAVRDWSFKI
ncbi:MAG: SDR family oxidoreductase [Terriglobia bacterium]